MNTFDDVAGLVAGELRFLRAKDVCAVLDVSRQQLHRMRHSGDFISPVQVTAKVVAFRSDDVLEWMNSRKPVDNKKAERQSLLSAL